MNTNRMFLSVCACSLLLLAHNAMASFASDLDRMLADLSRPEGPRQPFSNHPLDIMLMGVNEEIEANRREAERQLELARLDTERRRLEVEIAAEQRRVAAEIRARVAAERRRQEKESSGNIKKMVIGAAIGAAAGDLAGLDSQGTLEMSMKFAEAVVSDDPRIAQEGARQISNDYIQRRREQLRIADARRDGLASGAASAAPTRGYGTPTQPAAMVSAANSSLDSRFLGTYRSDLCPDTCYWQLDAGGGGVWSVGLRGRTVTVPIRWEPMRDANGGVQREISSQESGYLLKVTYQVALPEDVKREMTVAARDRNDNTVRVYENSSDGRCCGLNFRGKLNAYYVKQ